MDTLLICAVIYSAIASVMLSFAVAYHQRKIRSILGIMTDIADLRGAERKLEDKFRIMFNRRLNYQKSVLITLYNALEGAANGVTAEETLKKLEPYKDFIKNQKVEP